MRSCGLLYVTDARTSDKYASSVLVWSGGVPVKWPSIEGLLWSVSILCLFLAAILLRPVALIFALAWLVTAAIVIPLHLYRAWRKLAPVRNRIGYALWVLFETMLAAAAVALFVYFAAVS